MIRGDEVLIRGFFKIEKKRRGVNPTFTPYLKKDINP
jgi:hypothetical protein